jgi:anaerobic selenocysteine-containing dehydrogenase
MAEERFTWCRQGECMASLVATVEGGVITALTPNEAVSSGRGATCGLCGASMAASTDPRRLRQPRRRTPTGWEEVPWAEAIREIGEKLKAIRSQSGPRAIALYAGAPVGTSSQGTTRTLAVALGLGTPNLFSPLASTGGPWVRAGELMLGHPVALQGDVGRAHYVILLGANQEAQGWGPLQAGRHHAADLAFSRKTKGTKVIAADARKPPLAAGADLHLPIRPGTELFLLLGILDTIIKNGWHEKQYVADFTEGFDALKAAVAAWPVERVGEICGVAPESIAGVALKFSRAAMALAHRSPQMLQTETATLASWACIALHGITANLLRPGGLYENKGVLDIQRVAGQLPTEKAPVTRVGGVPLLLLQAPGLLLADEILTPGEGQVRALVSVLGNPAAELPGGDRLRGALSDLDLLVQIDVAENETSPHAHWILPATHPWEREDVHLHDTCILGWRETGWTPALVPPPGEARTEAQILADLFDAVGPTMRGGAHGAHLRALGALVARVDLPAWEGRALEFSGKTTLEELRTQGSWQGGEVDRAHFHITTPSGRINLMPASIAEALAELGAPRQAPGMDRWLQAAAPRDAALPASLHPDAGFAEGDRVRVTTEAGSVVAVVRLDEGLRPDTVDLPAGYATDVSALVPSDRYDRFTGAPLFAGLSCRVERA